MLYWSAIIFLDVRASSPIAILTIEGFERA
jgi:hypothetical protein